MALFLGRCATISSMDLGETMTFNCAGMQGQYVTITIPGRRECLSLCEVQVLGHPWLHIGEQMACIQEPLDFTCIIWRTWLLVCKVYKGYVAFPTVVKSLGCVLYLTGFVRSSFVAVCYEYIVTHITRKSHQQVGNFRGCH